MTSKLHQRCTIATSFSNVHFVSTQTMTKNGRYFFGKPN